MREGEGQMQILDTIKHLISFIKIFTFPSQLPEPLARNTAFPELKQFITFILLPFFQVGPLQFPPNHIWGTLPSIAGALKVIPSQKWPLQKFSLNEWKLGESSIIQLHFKQINFKDLSKKTQKRCQKRINQYRGRGPSGNRWRNGICQMN